MGLISKRHIKAWERFDDDLETFGKETEESESGEITLYEDAFTTRHVRYFTMTEEGVLTWTEDEQVNIETMYDEDDAREWLKFWRDNLRRARRYWQIDAETLDKIQDGEIEDEE